jgi:hypothetical protein
MIDAAQVERDRAEAERCKYQRGTQGVWARRWLALYDWTHAADRTAELLGVRAPAPRSEITQS